METGEMVMCAAPRHASQPRKKPPSGTADCHFHILGPYERYRLDPNSGYTHPPEVNIDSYLEMANTLGIERMVVVHPTAYGMDHACTFDAVERFGRSRARAIAVIDNSFDEAKLRSMAERGVCGARVNSITPNSTGLEQLQSVVRLIAPLGWHLQLYARPEQLMVMADTLLSLPIPVVIDHMGNFRVERGIDSPEFQNLLRLVSSKNCWVKLCGYRSSRTGAPYADLLPAARAIIAAAPDRCVWGSDWPHSRVSAESMPDDGELLTLLYDWAPDPQQLQRILVDNPARLYGFAV